MSSALPRLFLARHGDTAWTDARKHTGRTDLELNDRGKERAQHLGVQLHRFSFARVFSSPLKRALTTCEVAGFGTPAEIEPDLVEWNYGDYEGLLTAEILKTNPGWELFRDGCPGGESPADVAARADHFIRKVQNIAGDILIFSSGHIIRMIAARWLGLPPESGRLFFCRTASVGVLAFEHRNRAEPILALWNHVTGK